MKGIFAWPGFKTESIEFQANVRATARSTWSLVQAVAVRARRPVLVLDGAAQVVDVHRRAVGARRVRLPRDHARSRSCSSASTLPGYASLLIVMLFFNGLLLLSNGIQGEYIARIFEEVKGRPLFVVGKTFGLDGQPAQVVAAPSSRPSRTSRRRPRHRSRSPPARRRRPGRHRSARVQARRPNHRLAPLHRRRSRDRSDPHRRCRSRRSRPTRRRRRMTSRAVARRVAPPKAVRR